MLDALEATALAALASEGSRGAHYREDFPAMNEADALWNGFVSRSGAGTDLTLRGPPTVSLPRD